MYLPQIGERIRSLRKQKNLKQIDLATLLGVSKSVISSYENNTHYPPYDVLLSMSRIFGVSTDYLLGAEKHSMVSVHGLTERQIKAVTDIINELKELNKN